MTKRTFVLFLCLVQSMSLTLFPQRSVASCRLDIAMNVFSPFTVYTSEDPEDFILYDDSIPCVESIVRADPDDYEWKETLSNLLRHRLSTYRFLTEAVQIWPSFQSTPVPKSIRESIPLLAISKGDIALPSYYGYLHLLCPF